MLVVNMTSKSDQEKVNYLSIGSEEDVLLEYDCDTERSFRNISDDDYG